VVKTEDLEEKRAKQGKARVLRGGRYARVDWGLGGLPLHREKDKTKNFLIYAKRPRRKSTLLPERSAEEVV